MFIKNKNSLDKNRSCDTETQTVHRRCPKAHRDITGSCF